MQIIQYDAFDKSEKVVKEYEIKVNDSINLKKYEGNNIKILEINKQDVKILRNKVRYEILDRQEEKTRRYTEEVMENVEYGESIPVSIDEQKPFGPCYEMPRYSYSIKFIK